MIYVGIALAKKKFDYCIIDSELSVIKRGILINNNNGFSEFLRIIKKYKNIKLGIESTGIYHVNLYAYLINNNCNIILLNPMETKLLKSSRIRKNKTDKIDAEAIAKYIIIRKNNIITMEKNNENTYISLREYVYTYVRINRKIAMSKNQLIRDLDLLYHGLAGTINIDSKYFIEIISNMVKTLYNVIYNLQKIMYIIKFIMKKGIMLKSSNFV